MKKLFKNIHFINLFPAVFLNILFIPLWIIWKLMSNIDPEEYSLIIRASYLGTFTSFFELLFNTILNPIYLCIVNMVFSIKLKNDKYVKNIILMLLSCFLGFSIYYINWGIATGNLLKPDWGTIVVLIIGLSFIVSVIIIVGIIEQIYLKNKFKEI